MPLSELVMFKVKRAYPAAEPSDGYRVLVDRLWPRGVSKQRAKIDLWMKDVAPSDQLRKWFGHDPERWGEFQQCYRRELRDKTELLAELKKLERKHRTVTLVYSARDEDQNQAVVLRAVLSRKH